MSAISRLKYGSPNRFEVLSWYFMRVTGAVLLLVAVLHLLIMHVWYGVDAIDYRFVVGRWASPVVQVYDLALLLFAITHGVNGTRWVIDDYVHSRGWNLTLKSALYVLALIFILMGATVIFTYDPSASETVVGAVAAVFAK
ncbi:MAG TPA: succinate dehydrogenase [Anaerolineae bacterium]|nr:succinate dehydrogenase [Anaerolineae bacterium]